MRKLITVVVLVCAAYSALADAAYLSSATPSDWLPLDGNSTWSVGGATWALASVNGLRYEQSLSGQALY